MLSLMMRNHAQSLVEDEVGQQNYGFMWNMKSGNPDFGGFITVSFHCFYTHCAQHLPSAPPCPAGMVLVKIGVKTGKIVLKPRISQGLF